MENLEINLNGKKINLKGASQQIQSEKEIVESLKLTGDEGKDRLIIQDCIDKYKLKSNILYNGSKVYPFEKIVKEYRELERSNSLKNLSNEMYCFFVDYCEAIECLDKEEFKSLYCSFRDFEVELFEPIYVEHWKTDVDRIFKKLKIGEYFAEREAIDINIISKDMLKFIIEECRWNVIDNNDSWILEKYIGKGGKFSFNIDVSTNKISSIINNIKDYHNVFYTDEYRMKALDDRKNLFPNMSIEEIIDYWEHMSDVILELAYETLYKCRIIAINMEEMLEKDNKEIDERIYDNDFFIVDNWKEYDEDFLLLQKNGCIASFKKENYMVTVDVSGEVLIVNKNEEEIPLDDEDLKKSIQDGSFNEKYETIYNNWIEFCLFKDNEYIGCSNDVSYSMFELGQNANEIRESLKEYLESYIEEDYKQKVNDEVEEV